MLEDGLPIQSLFCRNTFPHIGKMKCLYEAQKNNNHFGKNTGDNTKRA